MEENKKILDKFEQYLYLCFDNTYLKYKEGICYQNFEKKTEYRIKSYFKKLRNILANKNLEEFFEEIKKRALFFEEEKKKIYEIDADFFYKIKYMCFYSLLVSHYVFLLQSINNLKINKFFIDFYAMEISFIKEIKNSNFICDEIGKQMYPEIKYREKLVNGFLKKKKKKKKIYERFSYLIPFSILFSIYLYIIFIFIRLIIKGYEFFFFVFPHKNLTPEEFFEKYGKKMQDMPVIEDIKMYLKELYNFFFTDLISGKGSFFLLIIFLFLWYHISKLDVFEKKKTLFRNECLQSNLLSHHRLLYSFFYIFNMEQTFTKKQWTQLEEKRVINIYDLYYILNKKPAEELLKVVVEYKRYIAYNVIKNEKSFMRISYMVEFQHCNLIIEFLEKKKKKDFTDEADIFAKKMIKTLNEFLSNR